MAKYKLENYIVTGIDVSPDLYGYGYNGYFANPINYNYADRHKKLTKIVTAMKSNYSNASLTIFFSEKELGNYKLYDKIPFYYDYTVVNGNSSVTGSYVYEDVINPSRFPRMYFSLLGGRGGIVVDSYITLEYGSVITPTILSTLKSGYLKPTIDNTISMSASIDNTMAEQFTITNGTLYYALITNDVVGSYQSIAFTGNQVTIPQNTLTEGNEYSIYVTATVDDGQQSSTTAVKVTTVDAIGVSTNISPKNQITDGTVTFDWDYSNQYGNEQLAFDLEVSQDLGANWETIVTHQVTNATSYEHTLTAGEYVWRVRSYNQGDVVGEWSIQTSFTNIAPPTQPVITSIENKGKPVIHWSGDNQIAYELEIVETGYTSGQIYQTMKTHEFDDYLVNGNYTMKLRIYNQYGQSSEWLEFEYSQNMNVVIPVFEVTEIENGYSLKITRESNIDKYLVYRNGVLISVLKGINNEINDIYCNGNIEYLVRAIDFNGNFADYTRSYTRSVKEVVLIDLSGNVYNLGRNIGSEVSINMVEMKDTKEIYYSGNRYPHYIDGDSRFKRVQIDSIFKDIPLGQVMYYKDYTGLGMWCMTHKINTNPRKHSNVFVSSIQVSEIEYSEVVEDE